MRTGVINQGSIVVPLTWGGETRPRNRVEMKQTIAEI